MCIEKESGFRASKFIDHVRAQALSNAGWSGPIVDWGNKPKQPKLKAPNKIHVLAADSEGIWLQVTVPRKIDLPEGGVPGEKVSPGFLSTPQA